MTPQPDSTPPGRAAVVTVVAAALVAAAARLPATAAPLGPDESGYTMVGRAWAPEPDSPFGPYWVDRPPLLIAVFRLADLVPGPAGIRWFGVVAAAMAVLAAAMTAREVVAHVRPGAARREMSVTVALTALATAALLATPSIDVLLTKGEVLSVPLLLGSAGLVLRALRTGSVTAAALSGTLAGTALGLKQNLVGAVVFGVVLLLLERSRSRSRAVPLLRLGGAFAAGVAVTVLGTVAWAVVSGVHLTALWEAVFGVRADAVGVILEGPRGSNVRRIRTLVGATATTGLGLVLLGLLAHVVRRGRRASSVAWATLAVAVVDGAGLLLGGFFRLPYLYALVPMAAVTLAILLTPDDHRGSVVERRVGGVLTAVVVGSAVVHAAPWLLDLPRFQRPSTATMLGRSLAEVSRPGDSLTMVLGSANAQLESGLPSPYEHLWSLPGRVRDPELEELTSVLEGRDAPTWVVVNYDVAEVLGEQAGVRLDTVLDSRYEDVGTGCGGRDVYRRVDRPRPHPVLGCAAMTREYGADWVAPVS